MTAASISGPSSIQSAEVVESAQDRGQDLPSSESPVPTPPGVPKRPGPLRTLLRLIVAAGSSRSTFGRVRAWLIILAMFVCFGLAGYSLAAYLAPRAESTPGLISE